MRRIYRAAFDIMDQLPEKPSGLPKLNCRYILVPALFTYRRFFRRYVVDAYLEYRLDVLARYVLHDLRDQSLEKHSRWDHPLAMWFHPYPMEKDESWQDISEADFEERWQGAVFPKGSRQRAQQDGA